LLRQCGVDTDARRDHNRKATTLQTTIEKHRERQALKPAC
jgi:hypothetical protein